MRYSFNGIRRKGQYDILDMSRSDSFDHPECDSCTDDISPIIHVKKLELCLFNHSSLTVINNTKWIDLGMRKIWLFDWFPLFLDGEREKGDRTPRGKRGTQRLEKGQTNFHRSNCLYTWPCDKWLWIQFGWLHSIRRNTVLPVMRYEFIILFSLCIPRYRNQSVLSSVFRPIFGYRFTGCQVL